MLPTYLNLILTVMLLYPTWIVAATACWSNTTASVWGWLTAMPYFLATPSNPSRAVLRSDLLGARSTRSSTEGSINILSSSSEGDR